MLAPPGNGFIAVFVAAIVLGIRRPDLRVHFERRADELVEIVKLGIFLVFGSLLTLHALTREGLAGARVRRRVFLLARPVAVWVALLGTPTDRATRLFMGWFGPKGVATMTFALLVLDRTSPRARASSTWSRWSCSARSSSTACPTPRAPTGSPDTPSA